MRLGIDFGTTRTVVAASDRGNYPVVSFVGESGDSCDWFPSVVAERGGELRFGPAALAVQSDPGWTLLRSFKRLLAGSEVTPELEVEVGALRLRVVELMARFLAALREAILERSNLPEGLRGDEALHAVAAVPANASSTQRFLTLEAFRRAGFSVQALINEPSAAGFEYTHRFRQTITSRRDHVVVYDLGGGTFDVSLLAMNQRHHEVVATAGRNRLGGDDFDAVLAALVGERAGAALPPRAAALLLDRCREAKEALSPQSRKVSVDLDGVVAGGGVVSLPVADYYARCEPLIEESIAAMAPVMARLEGESPDDGGGDIAGLYVVGGGSSLPAVGRALRERYGRRVHRSAYSFAATAIGLAIASDEASGFQLSDRFSRHFGVFREAEGGRVISFDPILTPETPLPAPGRPLRLRRRYRAAHNLGHFRFAECGRVADGRPEGDIVPFREALFPFDPGLRRPDVDLARTAVVRSDSGPLVEEEYLIDGAGIVEVEVRDLDTGYLQSFRLGG